MDQSTDGSACIACTFRDATKWGIFRSTSTMLQSPLASWLRRLSVCELIRVHLQMCRCTQAGCVSHGPLLSAVTKNSRGKTTSVSISPTVADVISSLKQFPLLYKMWEMRIPLDFSLLITPAEYRFHNSIP